MTPSQPSPTSPPRAAGARLRASLLEWLGITAMVLFVPIAWSVFDNRHSLQLRVSGHLLATAVFLLVPAAALAVLDAWASARSGLARRALRGTPLGAALGFALVPTAYGPALLPLAAWFAIGRGLPALPLAVRIVAVAVVAAAVPFAGDVLIDRPWTVLAFGVVLAVMLPDAAWRTIDELFSAIGLVCVPLVLAFVTMPWWLEAGAVQTARLGDGEPRRGPAFVLLFDGLAQEALLDGSGAIDARFPTYRRLAEEGVWIRDAVTNYDHTRNSVPSMLLGTLGWERSLAETPSLFEHLEGHYVSDVRGLVIDYCDYFPRASVLGCQDLRDWFDRAHPKHLVGLLWQIYLGATVHLMYPPEHEILGLTGAKRASLWLLDDLLRVVREEPLDNRFFYVHVLTPHTPFLLDPDGTLHEDRPGRDFRSARTPEDLARAFEHYRREIEFGNRFVGRLIEALEARGVWQDTTLIVTADHGYSWDWEYRGWGFGPQRNLVTDQIARITMLVKPPRGFEPRGAEPAYRGVDLVPTVLDLLGLEPLPGARLDGRSAFAERQESGPLTVISTTGVPWTRDPATGEWVQQQASTTSPGGTPAKEN